jgi:xylulokinase
MCVDVLEGNAVPPPQARLVRPRPEWRNVVAARWQYYRQVWSTVTGSQPPGTLDEMIDTLSPVASKAKPQRPIRSVLT